MTSQKNRVWTLTLASVAQSVERQSHNLKVVSSILTGSTFFLSFDFFFHGGLNPPLQVEVFFFLFFTLPPPTPSKFSCFPSIPWTHLLAWGSLELFFWFYRVPQGGWMIIWRCFHFMTSNFSKNTPLLLTPILVFFLGFRVKFQKIQKKANKESYLADCPLMVECWVRKKIRGQSSNNHRRRNLLKLFAFEV